MRLVRMHDTGRRHSGFMLSLLLSVCYRFWVPDDKAQREFQEICAIFRKTVYTVYLSYDYTRWRIYGGVWESPPAREDI